MKDVKVSVIMTAYNHGKYIERAIRSVVEQCVEFRYEIIVGDDASPDNTQEVIKELSREYPDIIVPVLRKENVGAMKNIADLFQRCKGEYIAFLEGDDFWTSKDKLQKQVVFLDNNKEFVACSHKNSIVDENENLIAEVDDTHCNHLEYTVDDLSDFILPGQTATLMIRKSVVFNFFTDERIRNDIRKIKYVPGDRILALALVSQGKVYCSNEVMSAYRYVIKEGGTNWTSNYGEWDSIKMCFYYINVRREIERLARKLDVVIDHRKEELKYFETACWNLLVLKRRKYTAVIFYMLLFCKHRKYLICNGTNKAFRENKNRHITKVKGVLSRWPKLLKLLKKLKMALLKKR